MFGFLVKKVVYSTARKVTKMDAGDLINQDTVNSMAKGAFHVIKHIFF